MATLAGYAGKVVVAAATVAEIGEWSIDVGMDLEDVTAFLDTAHKNAPTIQTWSATFSGRFDNTDTNGHVALMNAAIAGTSLAFKFYVDSTHYFTGNGYVKLNANASPSALVKASYSVTQNGALSYS